MEANRKRRGSSFIKGKLGMSFYRTPPNPATSVQYSTNKVKPSPPPSTTSVGYLGDQEFLVPSKNKKVSFVNPDGVLVLSSNKKVSYVKTDGAGDAKSYVKYSEYDDVGATGDDSVDLKAASYISYVQERFRLERVASERRNNKDVVF